MQPYINNQYQLRNSIDNEYFGGSSEVTFPITVYGMEFNKGKLFQIDETTSLCEFRIKVAQEAGLDVLPFLLTTSGEVNSYQDWRKQHYPRDSDIIGSLTRDKASEGRLLSGVISPGNTKNLIYSLSVSS